MSGGERRLYLLIYTLLYPAFLGAFIFGIFQKFPPELTQWPWNWQNAPWAVLFAAYFTLQHVEATSDQKSFERFKGVADLLELGAMIWLFHRLGYLSGAAAYPPLESGLTRGLMAAVFLLPVIGRAAKWPEENLPFHVSLSVLSGLAAATVLISPTRGGFCIIVFLLLVYLFAFQFLNHRLSGRFEKFKRPEPPPAAVE